jgi:hypothetical protein
MHTETEAFREVSGNPPLTLPRELWATLSREHQVACRSAEGLLALFLDDKRLLLRDVLVRTTLGVEQTLAGLRVLDGMALVSIEATDDGPLVKLVAVPEEHVRIVGPDGRARWLLVSRPLEAPQIEPSKLN